MAEASPPALDRRPDARAEPVEDLVRRATTGGMRVPEFQRGLRWGALAEHWRRVPLLRESGALGS